MNNIIFTRDIRADLQLKNILLQFLKVNITNL